MQELTLLQPDDWHVHLRDEEVVLGVAVVREAVDEDQTSFCLCRLGWSSCSGVNFRRLVGKCKEAFFNCIGCHYEEPNSQW